MENEENKKLSQYFKALAHPTRIAIILQLLAGKKCVTKIEAIVKARQANISQHLTILKACSIVDFKQEGKQKCYFLTNPKPLKKIFSYMKETCK
jgi:DNA-binding transcriptional ArsR family regulator